MNNEIHIIIVGTSYFDDLENFLGDGFQIVEWHPTRQAALEGLHRIAKELDHPIEQDRGWFEITERKTETMYYIEAVEEGKN